MSASRVSLHGRKRGWRQQLAADVLDELTILLRPGDHGDPFGIDEKCAPALLALGHAVPGEQVGDLLAALADQRGIRKGLNRPGDPDRTSRPLIVGMIAEPVERFRAASVS